MNSYRVPEVVKDGKGPFQLRSGNVNGQLLICPRDPELRMSASDYVWHTAIRSRSPVNNKNTSLTEINGLIEKAELVLDHGQQCFDIVALISGMPVHLRTNSAHLYNFWSRNWYLGNPEEALERLEHRLITIRAVMGLEENGKPMTIGAHYCPANRQIVFVNTDYYGQCKSWALGAAGVGLADFNIHSIHGACVEIDGVGVLIIAPTGTGKSTYTNALADYGLMNSDDWVYVIEENGQFFAVPSERSIYVRSNAVKDCSCEEHHHSLDEALQDPVMKKQYGLFQTSPAENVLWQNNRRVYEHVPNSRVMIDPSRLWQLTYKTPIKLVVLLQRDPVSDYKVMLTPDQVVEVLRKGEYMIGPGVTDDRSKFGTLAYESWYNPYLLQPDQNFEARRFLALGQSGAQCVIFNTHSRYARRQTASGEPDTRDLIQATTKEMLTLVSQFTGKKYS